jgi:Flp pilus assembly protein TadD
MKIAVSSRKLWGKVALAILTPVVLLLIVESLLELTDRGTSSRLLLKEATDQGLVWRTNPDFGRAFLRRENCPIPSPVWLPAKKREKVRRVLLIGESAAAGFPNQEFNLARFVEWLWNQKVPDNQIEVINLTMVAVNSHILRQFVQEGLRLEPDLIVLYAGHNEAIGPFGPASVFGKPSQHLSWIRFNIWARQLRTVRALDSFYTALANNVGKNLPVWGGLDEFREATIASDSMELAAMHTHAELNFRWMLTRANRAGVPVVLGVPGVNLTDWPPTSHGAALEIYRKGQDSEREGDWENAWFQYRLACDLDVHRFRADGKIRDILRRLSAEFPADVVSVADIDYDLHEGNERFKSDRAYFLEHVHLTFDGRVAAAQSIVAAMGRVWSESPRALSLEDIAVREGLLYTDWAEQDAWRSIGALLHLNVFRQMPDWNERLAFIDRHVKSHQEYIAKNWSVTSIDHNIRQAQELNPHDPIVDFIAGRLWYEVGLWDASQRHIMRGLMRQPNNHNALANLINLHLSRGDLVTGEYYMTQLEHWAPSTPQLPRFQGEVLARGGRYAEALPFFLRAYSHQSRDPSLLMKLAQVYMALGRYAEAIRVFEQCIDADPDNGHALNNLAWLLVTDEKSDGDDLLRALAYSHRAVASMPSADRFRGTLAVCYAAVGMHVEALDTAQLAISHLMKAGDKQALREVAYHLDRLVPHFEKSNLAEAML